MGLNKQCFQKYIKCTSNANDAGNANDADDASEVAIVDTVNTDCAANVTG